MRVIGPFALRFRRMGGGLHVENFRLEKMRFQLEPRQCPYIY